MADQDRLAQFKEYGQTVRRAATGRWDQVLRALAPETVDALDKLGRHTSCPSHGGKNGDAFRFVKEKAQFHEHGTGVCNSCGFFSDGFKVVMWLRGWGYSQAVKEVGATLGLTWDRHFKPEAINRLPPPPPPPAEVPSEELLERMMKVINGAHEVDWRVRNPITLYFRNRGLDGLLDDPPSDLLYVPSMAWSRRVEDERGRPSFEKHGNWPVMLALIRDRDRKIIGAHRTYLTAEGLKAPVPQVKKQLSSPYDTSGGAVHLYAAAEKLGVGEGIETILAVRAAHRDSGLELAVWSALNTSLLGSLQPPEATKFVLTYADHDAPLPGQGTGAGERAAERLAVRLTAAGVRNRIFLPPMVDTDWLDHYNKVRLRTVAPAPWERASASESQAPSAKAEAVAEPELVPA